jgi:hypothetical protein
VLATGYAGMDRCGKVYDFFEQPDAFSLGYGLAERLDGVKRCLERAHEAGGSVTGSGDDLPNEVASTFHDFSRSVASGLFSSDFFFASTSSISPCCFISSSMSRMRLRGGTRRCRVGIWRLLYGVRNRTLNQRWFCEGSIICLSPCHDGPALHRFAEKTPTRNFFIPAG